MKLLFKQRLFSWFDSYDIYDEQGNTVFTVQGQLSWGHRLEIYDTYNNHVGTVKEEIFTLLPRFALYINEEYVGQIHQMFSLFKPVYELDFNGWSVNGDIWQWTYFVEDPIGNEIMQASKQIMNLTDTYVIDIHNPKDTLVSLMIVLAIDAAKCSRK